MSRRSIARLAISLTILLLLILPLSSCSDDDEGSPTDPGPAPGLGPNEDIYLNEDNGHYYQAISGGFNWDAARDSAAASTFEELTGHLVCVDDEQENLFLYNNLGKDVQRFFLGGFQDRQSEDYMEPDGAWYWCNGDTLSYSAWHTGEPNGGGLEHYMAFIWGDAPVWNDVPRSWDMSAGFIIEYE